VPENPQVEDKSQKVQGLTLLEWEAAFRPEIVEVTASWFSFTPIAGSLVRIAFGNQGPVVNTAGNRAPVYTHAITLPQSTAVDLARILLKHYATPADDPGAPIAPISPA
jgi:hypothetical protein